MNAPVNPLEDVLCSDDYAALGPNVRALLDATDRRAIYIAYCVRFGPDDPRSKDVANGVATHMSRLRAFFGDFKP